MKNQIQPLIWTIAFVLNLCFLTTCTLIGNEDVDPDDSANSDVDLIEPDADWTVIMWINGDDKLEEATTHRIPHLQLFDKNPEKVTFIALFDRIEGNYTSKKDDWTGTRIYKIDYTGSEDEVTSTEIPCDELGLSVGKEEELNMADGNNLRKFVEFAQENYPAKHYFLTITGHGNAWVGDDQTNATDTIQTRMTAAMQPDTTTGADDFISNLEFANALAGKKLDLIMLESCTMGNIESLEVFKDIATYIIASPEVVWAAAEKEMEDMYDGAWNALVEDSTLEPEQLAVELMYGWMDYWDGYAASAGYYGKEYEQYMISQLAGAPLSVYQMDQLPQLIEILDSQIPTYLENMDLFEEIQKNCHYYVTLDPYYSIDLYDLAEWLSDTDLQKAIEKFVVYSYYYGTDELPYGLSIFFPRNNISKLEYDALIKAYTKSVPFSSSTSWVNLINSFMELHPIDASIIQQWTTISSTENHPVKGYFQENQGYAYFEFFILIPENKTLTITQLENRDDPYTIFETDIDIIQSLTDLQNNPTMENYKKYYDIYNNPLVTNQSTADIQVIANKYYIVQFFFDGYAFEQPIAETLFQINLEFTNPQ